MSSIRISEKHGVNPSLETCFWCGESMGVVLFGKLKGDVKAPREVIISYEPCKKCAEEFAKGCQLIEVDTKPAFNGAPVLQKQGDDELYPTGRCLVITKEAALRIFEGFVREDNCSELCLDKQLFEHFWKQFNELPKNKKAKRRKLSKKVKAFKFSSDRGDKDV